MNADKGEEDHAGTPRGGQGWFARSLRRLGLTEHQVASDAAATRPGDVSPDRDRSAGADWSARSAEGVVTDLPRSKDTELEAKHETLRASNAELLEKVRVLEGKVSVSEVDNAEIEAPAGRTLGHLKSENETLSERSRMLQSDLSATNMRNTLLQSELDALQQAEVTLQSQLRVLKRDLAAATEKETLASQKNDELRARLTETRQRLTESRNKVIESLKTTRERLVTTSALWAEARKYFSLFRQGLFADEIAKSDISLAADTYLCLLPSTVPAALDLQRRYGGRIICDCVENVEVERHSLAPKIHRPALDMVNISAYGALSSVDGMMTVSQAVARTLERFGPPVRLQPNYRRYENPTPSGNLREMFELSPDATVIITSGNIVKGFEAVIDAMALLPEHIHLIALSKFSPAEYNQRIEDYLAESGLAGRIHLHGFVPYDELSALISDADMGIITLDPDNPNHSVSLPNRVFDFTTATLPFVVPQLPEIAAFVEEHECGVAVESVTAEAWADGVKTILENLDSYKAAMVRARAKVTWESLDDGLFEFLGSPQSVTLLGFRDLSRYQRFLRVTDSLTNRGVKVKAAFFSEAPAPIKNPDADFYHFTDRYGRGPGLIEVPHEGEFSPLED